MAQQLSDQVRSIISEQLGVELANIRDDASFIDDLGADSLAVVELVLAFEEQFDIKIPDDQTQNIQTVADVVSYIQQHAA
ncbi:MAG: Acyl carrier protein [Myxococcaceae bacterium]|nr:Acyl carrier protein [Myxococcaceae bacterium]